MLPTGLSYHLSQRLQPWTISALQCGMQRLLELEAGGLPNPLYRQAKTFFYPNLSLWPYSGCPFSIVIALEEKLGKEFLHVYRLFSSGSLARNSWSPLGLRFVQPVYCTNWTTEALSGSERSLLRGEIALLVASRMTKVNGGRSQVVSSMRGRQP